MGYMLRVRLASFFAGVATASAVAFYVLHRDYKIAHDAISHQAKTLYESLDERILALERLKDVKSSSQHLDAAE